MTTFKSKHTGSQIDAAIDSAIAIKQEVEDARAGKQNLNTRITTISNFASPNAGDVHSGLFYDNSFHAANSATLALTNLANRLTVAPFYTSRDLSIDQIGVAVSTAAASSLGKILIYSSTATERPGLRLLNPADELDFSTSGFKAHSVDFTFEAGRQYWIGLHCVGTAAIRSIPITSAVNLGLTSSSGNNYFTAVSIPLGYPDDAPASWAFATSQLQAITPPSFRFRAL